MDRSLRQFALKPMALMSFCGGPLLASGALKPTLGDNTFAATFAPVMLILFGALFVNDRGWFATLVAWGGILGCLLLCAFNLWALGSLWTAPPQGLVGLHLAGIAVGFVSVWLYAREVKRAWSS